MKYWKVFMALCLVMVCAVVVAQEVEVTPEAPSQIAQTIDWIAQQVFTVLGIAIAGFLIKLIVKVAKKYGIEIDASKEEMIRGYAMDALGYAEEWAIKKINLDKIKINAEDKFNKAVKKLTEKVPMISETVAKDLVVANLPKFRAMIGDKIKKGLPNN